MFLILIAIGWLYVAVLMAVAEASSPGGTLLGAVITLLLYGIGPVALLIYILSTPARRRLRRQRETQAQAAWEAEQAEAQSAAPDAGGQAAADAVAPMRKEP